MNYSEQIKTPQWQRMRLEIFSRDNFSCRCCGSQNKQLHAHHLYYLPNTMIWEYDIDGIVTVCENCHEILTKELSKIAGHIAFDILTKKLKSWTVG